MRSVPLWIRRVLPLWHNLPPGHPGVQVRGDPSAPVRGGAPLPAGAVTRAWPPRGRGHARRGTYRDALATRGSRPASRQPKWSRAPAPGGGEAPELGSGRVPAPGGSASGRGFRVAGLGGRVRYFGGRVPVRGVTRAVRPGGACRSGWCSVRSDRAGAVVRARRLPGAAFLCGGRAVLGVPGLRLRASRRALRSLVPAFGGLNRPEDGQPLRRVVRGPAVVVRSTRGRRRRPRRGSRHPFGPRPKVPRARGCSARSARPGSAKRPRGPLSPAHRPAHGAHIARGGASYPVPAPHQEARGDVVAAPAGLPARRIRPPRRSPCPGPASSAPAGRASRSAGSARGSGRAPCRPRSGCAPGRPRCRTAS